MTTRSRWDRVRSAEFFRGKAVWYRAMAGHAVGDDREKMLDTARLFDARGDAQEAAEAGRAAAAGARRAGRHPRRGGADEDRATFHASDRRQGR
jgi:hypothetical protein